MQTHDTVSINGQSSTQQNGNTQQSVNTFTGNKSHKIQGNTYQDSKRKTYGDAGNQSKKRKQPQSASGGSSSGTPNTKTKLTLQQYMAKVTAGLRAVNSGNSGPKYKVARLREKRSNGELPAMDFNQAAKAIQQDHCIVCQ